MKKMFYSFFVFFIYVLSEIKTSWYTLQTALIKLPYNAYGIFIWFFLVSDILLHAFVSVICVFAIEAEDNISDKLQAALAFFFILEIDEWSYKIFFVF